MHPDDAAARGLADDDLVRVFNELGEVHCPLTVAAGDPARDGQPAERASGAAARATASTGTALVPDTLTDLGGGACFNDARVQVASLATA